MVETDTPVKRKDCRSGVDCVGTSVVGTAATQRRRKLWSSSEEVVSDYALVSMQVYYGEVPVATTSAWSSRLLASYYHY